MQNLGALPAPAKIRRAFSKVLKILKPGENKKHVLMTIWSRCLVNNKWYPHSSHTPFLSHSLTDAWLWCQTSVFATGLAAAPFWWDIWKIRQIYLSNSTEKWSQKNLFQVLCSQCNFEWVVAKCGGTCDT